MWLHCKYVDHSRMNLCRSCCSSGYNSTHNGDGGKDYNGDDGDDGGDNNHSNKDSNKDSKMGRNIPNSCSSKGDSTMTKKDTTNYNPNRYLHPNSWDCKYTNTYWCSSHRNNLYLSQDCRNGECGQCRNNHSSPIHRKQWLLWYWLQLWFRLSKEYLQVPKLPLQEHLL